MKLFGEKDESLPTIYTHLYVRIAVSPRKSAAGKVNSIRLEPRIKTNNNGQTESSCRIQKPETRHQKPQLKSKSKSFSLLFDKQQRGEM